MATFSSPLFASFVLWWAIPIAATIVTMVAVWLAGRSRHPDDVLGSTQRFDRFRQAMNHDPGKRRGRLRLGRLRRRRQLPDSSTVPTGNLGAPPPGNEMAHAALGPRHTPEAHYVSQRR